MMGPDERSRATASRALGSARCSVRRRGAAGGPGPARSASLPLALQKVLAPCCTGPFWERLRELGWIEGQTITVERRGAGGDANRIPSLAAELAELKVNVILAGTGAEAKRAQEGRTVPICAAAGDLQAEGLVTNLAKPEGNVSGVQVVQPDLVGKRLLAPQGGRTWADAGRPAHSGPPPTMSRIVLAAEDSSRTLGLTLHVVEGARPERLRSSVSQHWRKSCKAGGLLGGGSSPGLIANMSQLVALAAAEEAPCGGLRSLSGSGRKVVVLTSYGPVVSEFNRGWAECADQILARGAKPAGGIAPCWQPHKVRSPSSTSRPAKALGLRSSIAPAPCGPGHRVTCPACGKRERRDRKTVLVDAWPAPRS